MTRVAPHTAPDTQANSVDLTAQALVVALCRGHPIAAALYVVIACLWRYGKGRAVPLSLGDVHAYDPTITSGAFRRAIAYLITIRAIKVSRSRGGKNRYTPLWVTNRGETIPWQVEEARYGRPPGMTYVGIPPRILATCLGSFVPHPSQPAVIERWVTHPLLTLRDVGVWVVGAYERTQGQPIPADDDYARLAAVGLVTTTQGQTTLCELPTDQAILRSVVERAFGNTTAISLTPAGWLKLGIGPTTLPPVPPSPNKTPPIQRDTMIGVGFAWPAGVIGQPIGDMIGGLIGQPITNSTTKKARLIPSEREKSTQHESNVSVPRRERRNSRAKTDQHHADGAESTTPPRTDAAPNRDGGGIPAAYHESYTLLVNRNVGAADEFMHLSAPILRDWLADHPDWPGPVITKHLRLCPPTQTTLERQMAALTASPITGIHALTDNLEPADGDPFAEQQRYRALLLALNAGSGQGAVDAAPLEPPRDPPTPPVAERASEASLGAPSVTVVREPVPAHDESVTPYTTLPLTLADALDAIQHDAAHYGFTLPAVALAAIHQITLDREDGEAPLLWPPLADDTVVLHVPTQRLRDSLLGHGDAVQRFIAILADLRPEYLTVHIRVTPHQPPLSRRNRLLAARHTDRL